MTKKKPRTKQQALLDLGALLGDIFPYLHSDYREALLMAMNALERQETATMNDVCVICGNTFEHGREVTCSDACHEELVNRLVAQFGEFKKVVRASTGEAFKVPTRDIIEKGVREQDLDNYPRWEE